uniref:Uncharacterized protein n=1 Tax=Anguilla anguilla TaxID=7936 RepID=A0A0E9X4R7_ANGAN
MSCPWWKISQASWLKGRRSPLRILPLSPLLLRTTPLLSQSGPRPLHPG